MRLSKLGTALTALFGILYLVPVASRQLAFAVELDPRGIPLTIQCLICDTCAGGHVAQFHMGGLRGGLDHPGSCMAGPCQDYHPTGCVVEDQDEFRADLATAWQTAATATGVNLRRLIAKGADGIVKTGYNEKRQSIQFYGCNGIIIGNLPLSTSQLESLSE
jgi:hypothetical protein